MQPGDGEPEGQTDITQYPEYMPETYDGGQEKPLAAAGDTKGQEKPGMTRTQAEPAEAAGAEDPGAVIRDSDGLELYIKNQTDIITDDLKTMSERCRQHNWDGLIERAYKVIERAEAVRNMEEMWHG